jgi:hypothetical protein
MPGNTFGFATRARWAHGSRGGTPGSSAPPTLDSTPTSSSNSTLRVTIFRRNSAAFKVKPAR